jgi:hypothetical protein
LLINSYQGSQGRIVASSFRVRGKLSPSFHSLDQVLVSLLVLVAGGPRGNVNLERKKIF